MKINLLLRIFAVISLIIFLTYSVYKIPRLTYGFAAYYTYSKILIDGGNLSDGYNADYFNQKITEYGFQNIYDLYNIIPTNVFVYLVVAWLEPLPAKIVWGIISILLLGLSLLLLFKTFKIKLTDNTGLLCIIVIFLWHPLYENIALGQMYILVLFLFSLCLYGVSRGNKFSGSIPVALGIASKGYGILLYLWFLATKRYKEFLISVLILVLLIVITLPIIHISTWKTFVEITGATLGRFNEDSNVAYQNINGFIRHLLVYDKDLNPNSIANIPSNIAFYVVIIINLSFIMLLLIKARKYYNNKDSVLISCSAMIAASVLTAPMAEEYTFILFIPLTFVIGITLYNNLGYNRFTLINILYVLSVLMLLLPLHYKDFQMTAFPVYLLAYPKLYGGLIMIGLYFTKSLTPDTN